MKLAQHRLRRRDQASSALVIVLFAVVLVTIMILALLTGAKFERQSAFYYKERIRADALAQSGIDHAIGLLRTGMGGVTNGWISGPGEIIPIAYNTNNNTSTVGTPIFLSSGTNMVAPPANTPWASADFNAQLLDGTYPIDGAPTNTAIPGATPPQMLVRWIYVRRDGSLDASDIPATTQANPIVGRYAFWVDDSSSRLNLNTAYQRANNTNTPGDLSRIDLTTIPNFAAGTVAGDTHAYATNNFFNSDYDLRAANIYSAVSSNRFNYTFYNHSSDGLNPFGRPKIYLTTQSAYLPPGFTNMPGYTNYYFDILANDTGTFVDPGRVGSLSDANISAVVNNLCTYLTNSTWPEFPGTSFASKFWHSTTTAPDPRIYQMAVNIIEYVRAKESTNIIVEPIRGYVNSGATTSFTSTTVSADSVPRGSEGNKFDGTVSMPIIGVTRTPLIDEVGVFWDTASSGAPYLDAHAEVYLPPNVGIDTLAASQIVFGFRIGVSGSSDGWVNFASDGSSSYAGMKSGGGMFQGFWFTVTPSSGVPTFPLNSTNRFARVGSGVQWPTGLAAPTSSSPLQAYVWTCLMPNNDLEVVSTAAPLDMGGPWGTGAVNLPEMIGPITLYTNSINPYDPSYSNSYQINDPLMGAIATNWVSEPQTWGAANSAVVTLGKRPSTPVGSAPYADVGPTGFVTNIGWRMPYPYLYAQTNAAGATTNVPNPTGRMDSLAELGYVNTGAVDWSGPTANLDQNGVPYRTLHFQPSKTRTLPDWALLDLFALPPSPQSPATFPYQPYGWTNVANTYNGVGGRININGLLYPFTNSTTRLAPLIALLSGATNPVAGTTNSMATAGLLATNILFQTNSSGVSLGTIGITGQAFDSTNGLYAHIGALAEVAGMADAGEASEANLYEPLAQTTVSGNVFTIYTIGQALQQLPSGGIVVNGEKRYQATVERIPTVPASTTSGLYRNVVIRELNQ